MDGASSSSSSQSSSSYKQFVESKTASDGRRRVGRLKWK